MILNKEQVELLTDVECEQHLKKLAKAYPLDKELALLDKATFDQVDEIANTLLWLEDRIKSLDISEKLTKANLARWADK
jgi:nicotinate-nucleotide pyrophosphorylase